MSYLVEEEIDCPYCKYPNRAEVWSIVNTNEDPELKDLLLGGELNMVECESCSKVFYAEHFLLYHDPANEIMAFVYPHAHKADAAMWQEKAAQDFKQSQEHLAEDQKVKYSAICLFGLNELVELVEKDEEVGIQGEIVKALAEEHRFPIKEIRPSVARTARLPRVLPYPHKPGLSPRDTLIDGLKQLSVINDRLFVYQDALHSVLEDPSIDVPVQ